MKMLKDCFLFMALQHVMITAYLYFLGNKDSFIFHIENDIMGEVIK